MSRGTPEADDFTFVIDGSDGKKYDAYIEVLDGYTPFQLEVDCRTRLQGESKWAFLYSATIYDFEKLEGNKANEALSEALEEISIAIKKAFGVDSSPIPAGGRERIEWLVKNALTEKDNIVSIKHGNE